MKLFLKIDNNLSTKRQGNQQLRKLNPNDAYYVLMNEVIIG